MERKIKNVFAQYDYHCFGCSPHNPTGLQLEFWQKDDVVESIWRPSQQYEGYPGNVHGGITAALLDEVAAWTVYILVKCAGVTSRMNIRYRRGLPAALEEVVLRGKVKEMNRNLCTVSAEILDRQGVLYAEAEIVYFTFSPEKSVKEAYYPENYDSFFE